MSENNNMRSINTKGDLAVARAARNFFNTKRASKSFYNSLIENPIYYEKNKGITYDIVFMHPLEFFEIISQYMSPSPCKVEDLLKALENDPNTQTILDYYNKHKEESNIFNLCSLDYNYTPEGNFFEYDGKHRMFVIYKLFGDDIQIPVMIIKRESIEKNQEDLEDAFIEEDLEKIKLTWVDVNNLAKKGYKSKGYFDITQTFNSGYINKYFIADDGALLCMKDNHNDFDPWLYHLQTLGYEIQNLPEFNNENEAKDYGFSHMYPLQYLGMIRVGRDIYLVDEEVGNFSTCVYIELPKEGHITPAQIGKIKDYLEIYLDANDEDVYGVYLCAGENVTDYTGATSDLDADYLIKQITGDINYYSHHRTFRIREDLEEAVHYGDLGKADYRRQFGNRHTGGYGTGTYFLSKELDYYSYNLSDRPIHRVDISKYNLFKPKTYERGKELHDVLRDINNRYVEPVQLTNDIELKVYDLDADDYIPKEFNDEAYQFTRRLRKALGYEFDFNVIYNALIKAVAEIDDVAPSTHIMQELGYEGIDVTDIPELDNEEYGSVVYDLNESLDDDFHLPKKLAHYGLGIHFAGDAIIWAKAFKDKEKAKNIISIAKTEYHIPARLIPQKDKFGVYICRKGFPKDFEGWNDIKGLKEDLEEKKDDHASAAIRTFGTTNDMLIAGYLTKDGEFIRLGEEGCVRGEDHRSIHQVYDDDETFSTATDYMLDFMSEGNIRLIPERPGMDTMTEPTREQYNSLYRYIYYFWVNFNPRKDEFIFEVSDKKGHTKGSKVFNLSKFTPTTILSYIRDYFAGKVNLETLDEAKEDSQDNVLLEKTRGELITKSRRGDRYKDQSLGRNRWERRNRSRIANRVDQYNKIDMNSLFKEDALKVGIHVYGETNEYIVTIKLNGVIKEIENRVKANGDKFEYKCVYMAIQSVMNSDNVYVSCSCPDWRYRMAVWATNGDYNSGSPEVRPADITNPNDTKGAGCKHVNLVIGNIQWVLKVASVINNYVHYMEKTPQMQRLFADFIFPKIFGIPYKRAVQLSLFDIDDDLKDDEETIALSNKYGRQRNNNIGQSTRGVPRE